MKWLILFSLIGCTQITSLNLKKHQFGNKPSKIIWFQIAGLEEEQIAMLRFQQLSEVRTSFEDNVCMGKSWSYNLYQLRNSAESSFLSQMTGKKNIKNSCDDAQLKPVWKYILENGFKTAIIEVGASEKQSLKKFQSCSDEGNSFLKDAFYFLRSEAPQGSQLFHFAEEMPFSLNQFIYDKTCGPNSCTSTIRENVRSIQNKLKTLAPKHLMIVRDFSYLRALENKDWKKARQILGDLEQSFSDALKNINSEESLVLLTSGDSRYVDMPDQGKSWYEFDKENKNISVKRSKITNLVLASGARAENFCGIYDDADIFQRLILGPEELGLELKMMNPFKFN